MNMINNNSNNDNNNTNKRGGYKINPQQNLNLETQNDDGWQVIHTFFDILDQDNKGRIDKSDIIHGLQVIGDVRLVEALHLSPLNAHDTISKNQLYKIFFHKRDISVYQQISKGILIWILPTFYSASTRLPFISIPLEIVRNRNGSLQQVGIIIGLYQTSRAFANGIITAFGGGDPLRKLHLYMICSGLIGWFCCAFGPHESVWTLLSVCLVGFAEVIVNLQNSLLKEVRKESPANVADQAVLTHSLRQQYMNVSFGSCIAYIIGGFFYTNFGFTTTSLLGIACQLIQIIFTVVYILVSNEDVSSKEISLAEDSVAKAPQDFYERDDQRFIRAILYKLKALSVLIEEAAINSSEYNPTSPKRIPISFYEEQKLRRASKMAKKNPILMGSMRYLYYSFTKQAREERMMVASMMAANVAAQTTNINMTTPTTITTTTTTTTTAAGAVPTTTDTTQTNEIQNAPSFTLPQITSMTSFDIYTPMLQMMETNEEVLQHSSRSRSTSQTASRASTRSRTSRSSPTRSVGRNGGLTGGYNTPGSISTTTLQNLEENETISDDPPAPINATTNNGGGGGIVVNRNPNAPLPPPSSSQSQPSQPSSNTFNDMLPPPPSSIDNNMNNNSTTNFQNSHSTVQITNQTPSQPPQGQSAATTTAAAAAAAALLPPMQTFSHETASTTSTQPLNYENLARVAVKLIDRNGNGLINEQDFTSFLAPRVYQSIYGGFESSSVNIVWPYLKWVVATQAVMALCIGTFLSTSLLMYTQQFGIDAEFVGFLLGVGEGVGAIIIYCAAVMDDQRKKEDMDGIDGMAQYDIDSLEDGNSSDDPVDKGLSDSQTPYLEHTDDDNVHVITGNSTAKDDDYPTKISTNTNIWKTLITRPLHLPVILIILGASTIMFSTPIFTIAIFFQMCVSAVNDLSVSFLNELIGSSMPPHAFKKYQSTGQWLRRLGNSATGILGPVLFGIHPKFPFMLFGCIVFGWAVIIWFVFYCHLCTIADDGYGIGSLDDGTTHGTDGSSGENDEFNDHPSTGSGGIGAGGGLGTDGISTHYTPHISEYNDNETTIDRLKLCSSSMYNRPFSPLSIFHQTVDMPLYMMEREFFNLHREELEEEFVDDNEIIVSDTWDTV